MLREPPQPQQGSVPCLPDWPLPPEHAGRSRGDSSSNSSSSSIGDGSSSSSSDVSVSGNGAGPARQQPQPAAITGSQLSCGEPGGGAPVHTAGAVSTSSGTPAQALRQQSVSTVEAGGRHHSGLHVEFRDVSFRYSQSAGADRAQEDLWASVDFSAVESPAAAAANLAADAPMQLQGITFALQPGEALGIVGPPGACTADATTSSYGGVSRTALHAPTHRAAHTVQ
jgi:ABC-type multidrug transport system fused ATPase/permease subunit